jgi:hypothetical protein
VLSIFLSRQIQVEQHHRFKHYSVLDKLGWLEEGQVSFGDGKDEAIPFLSSPCSPSRCQGTTLGLRRLAVLLAPVWRMKREGQRRASLERRRRSPALVHRPVLYLLRFPAIQLPSATLTHGKVFGLAADDAGRTERNDPHRDQLKLVHRGEAEILDVTNARAAFGEVHHDHAAGRGGLARSVFLDKNLER